MCFKWFFDLVFLIVSLCLHGRDRLRHQLFSLRLQKVTAALKALKKVLCIEKLVAFHFIVTQQRFSKTSVVSTMVFNFATD